MDRLYQLAVRVWGCEKNPLEKEEVILQGISCFRSFLKRIGMPSSIKEFGGSEDDIDDLAHVACYGAGRDGKLHGFVELTEDEIKEIYRMML